MQAVEQHIGLFCAGCTCQLRYHLSDDDDCELCGCDEVRLLCATCGNSRPLEMFAVGSKTCTYCINIPPVKIKPAPNVRLQNDYSDYLSPTFVERYNRGKEARLVLKELTE